MTMGEFWSKALLRIKYNELNNLKFHYNGVKQGKWSLSPKYESLQELEDLIKEKENKL